MRLKDAAAVALVPVAKIPPVDSGLDSMDFGMGSTC